MIGREDSSALLGIARGSIAEELGAPPVRVPDRPIVRASVACFVTLHRAARLHGCIGSFGPRPLGISVRHNALAAAFEDPRAQPLSLAAVDELEVEISLLSARTPLAFDSEQHVREQLRSGVDGLVLEFGRYRGVFLPQVWESLPRPHEFLDHLKLKAGLPPDFWAPGLTLERFTVEKLVDPARSDARAHGQLGS